MKKEYTNPQIYVEFVEVEMGIAMSTSGSIIVGAEEEEYGDF